MDLEIKSFAEIDISDAFFDSLKSRYQDFEQWFSKKAAAGETAYVFYDSDGFISDFLYLKVETGIVEDVTPLLPAKKRLKVGTFILVPRGTRRGERFMKKIMDRAIAEEVDEIYVTIFPDPELVYLIDLFKRFGFIHVAEKKHNNTKSELVLVKDLHSFVGDIEKDYPFIKLCKTKKYLLAIDPLYHTKMFPESILMTESYDMVQDITPANGIYKTYICWMRDASLLKRGDNIVIYRKSDGKGPAYYRSVATSVCTVKEIKRYLDFVDIDDFLRYTQYSVFSSIDRRKWFVYKNNFIVIKMLYNLSFVRRIVRKSLIEDVGIPPEVYWGLCELTEKQYRKILELGGANERYFIY